jgi:hypothetical protein
MDKERQALPIQLEWTYKEQSELLNRLDSSAGNGITTTEFQILFSRCKECKRVGVRPAMRRHICSEGMKKREG